MIDSEGHSHADERDDPRVLWPLLALFWLGNIAVTMGQVYASQRSIGAQPTFLDLARWVLPGYIVWLFSVPFIVFVLARRFRFEEGRWRNAVPVHLAVSLAIAAATLAVDTLFALRRRPELEFAGTFVEMAASWALWIVFTYWFFLAVLLAVRHYTAAAARKLRSRELEAAVASAQLATLRTQLHPHFLFNALNSISSLVLDEPRAARRMIARLGDLLRASLAEGDHGSWSLRNELELLERYTDIEKLRFGERLNVEIGCRTEALDARLPPLLLQPLVENAIVHGIQPTVQGGTVRVIARRDDGRLCIEVSDDGVGIPEPSGDAVRERVGLSNTRERLSRQFHGAQVFEITRREPSGTRIRIEIPFSVARAAEEVHGRVR